MGRFLLLVGRLFPLRWARRVMDVKMIHCATIRGGYADGKVTVEEFARARLGFAAMSVLMAHI